TDLLKSHQQTSLCPENSLRTPLATYLARLLNPYFRFLATLVTSALMDVLFSGRGRHGLAIRMDESALGHQRNADVAADRHGLFRGADADSLEALAGPQARPHPDPERTFFAERRLPGCAGRRAEEGPPRDPRAGLLLYGRSLDL